MAGRPRLYNDPEELNQECDKYFAKCKEDKDKPTVTGLALFLGFASKQSLYDYDKNEQFSYPIKRALLQVENSYESALYGNNVAGPVFALKNMGWKDKVEQEQYGKDGGPIQTNNQHTVIFKKMSGGDNPNI